VLSRGIRLNNPGNIRKTGFWFNWQGLGYPQDDLSFVRFRTAAWGVRAIAKTLLTYQSKHGLYTIAGIIARWAPPHENNTAAYVASVSAYSGIGAHQKIRISYYPVMYRVVLAIIRHENGTQPYPKALIDAGLRAAGVGP
jgi:hypothetical protein